MAPFCRKGLWRQHLWISHWENPISKVMEAVLLGLDEAVCTRQGLLWTLTYSALQRLRVHTRNLPAPLHLLHTHRCVSRPLYQVGRITRAQNKLSAFISVHLKVWNLGEMLPLLLVSKWGRCRDGAAVIVITFQSCAKANNRSREAQRELKGILGQVHPQGCRRGPCPGAEPNMTDLFH